MMTDRTELAAMIDHTLLRSDAGPGEIRELCLEAARFGFASVCVNPLWVSFASELLTDESPLVCSVVGFPLGATNCVETETSRAVEDGAGEIDMVIPVGHLKYGDLQMVSGSISAVVREASGNPVKVIIETCLLTDDEKVTACRLAEENGAAWVKTSTGFSTGGATVQDVKLMRDAVGGRLGVKASGGIRTLADALAMVEAGAGRLGTSSGVRIVEELDH